MARYQITQSRNFQEPVILASGIRRFNGAVTILNQQADDTRSHLRSKAGPNDRVVEGPTGVDNEIAVVLFGPNVDLTVVTAIRKV